MVRVAILVVFLLCNLVNWSCAIGDHRSSRVLSSFTFTPPFFPGSGTATVPGWEVRGDTVVESERILLTDGPSRFGSLINRRPFFLKTVELTLHFRITGGQTVGGDGIRFWLADQPITNFDNEIWKGLVVITETNNGYHDSKISVHFNDGTKNFNNEETYIGGCLAPYRNAKEGSYIHLYIEEDLVNVFVDVDASGKWVRCFDSTPVLMPNRYFFGFTGKTGESTSDLHELLSLSVNTMDEKLAMDSNMPRPPPELLELNAQDNDDQPQVTNDKKEDPEILELQRKIRELESRNKELQNSLDESEVLLGEKFLEEEARQKQIRTDISNLEQIHKELKLIEQSQTGCSQVFTECSNLPEVRKTLTQTIAELQDTMGHEIVAVGQFLSKEIGTVDGFITPFQSELTSLADQIEAVSVLVDSLSLLQIQMERNFAEKQEIPNHSAKLEDVSEKISLVQSTLAQVQIEHKKVTTQIRLMTREDSSSGFSYLTFLAAILLFVQTICLLMTSCRKQTSKWD